MEFTVVELREMLRYRGLPVSGNKADLVERLRMSRTSRTGRTSRKSRMSKGTSVPDNVVDKDLYRRVRNRVKKRVKVWPSAYASGQVVSEYKKAGGRYRGSKKGGDLDRWYKEKWVNVCKPKSGGGYAKCGRKKSSIKEYPYCRPSVRVNSKTPKTVAELKKSKGKEGLKKMCAKKRKKGLPKKGRPRRVSQ